MAAISTGLTSFSAMLRRKRVLPIDHAAIQAHENKISDVMNLLDKEPIHLGIKHTIVTVWKERKSSRRQFRGHERFVQNLHRRE